MRVVLADPPAFTPFYDHDLARSLAALGVDVELVTSRFRFGDVPAPDGYARSDVFYPLSSRLFGRSPLRIPLKVLEHPFGMARLLGARRDVLHVQWLSVPQLDELLLRTKGPLVFTAHDLLPRRTKHKVAMWQRLWRRFDRIVVHSTGGLETLAGLGVDRERLRVIPLPTTRTDPARTDDGRTVLCLGLIRPYKGLADAIEAVKRVDGARLLVAGDPREPMEPYTEAAGDRAEFRLGFLSEEEVARAIGEATIAAFPYRAELDQSAALLQVIGAGVPAVVYDVGGMAEPVKTFGAGRVVPAGDIDALADAIRELLHDPSALAEARAGAERARETLTWEASAAAHLDLYRELT